ncbi:unnamed protein product, partial [Brenthis ino]
MSGMAREYISYARQLSANGCFTKSVDLYFMAFERSPQLKISYEPEFRAVMTKMNEALAAANKIEDIFSNFSRAINIFPGNIYLLNEIGKYLYKFGFYEEAWSQFQKALVIDAGYVTAEKNLNSLKNLMVERWHFRMLNDKIRNDSYRAAINEKVIPKKTNVLDLGTGTGLLAMYATERNPMGITACDSSEVMAALADCILEENRLLMSVVVINKMSTSMNYTEIGGKRSLLITELFDAGLFGEHVLQSLSHAWENLLTPDAEILPRKAEFFIMGANSELLSAKYQLCSKAKSLLEIPYLSIHILTCDETYDCEDVHLYKDIKYITAPESVVKVDFNNVHDILDKLHNSEPYVVDLKVAEKGEINTFIGWFNLYLTENITITTDPRDKNRANAWQQAVFFDNLPKNVQENDTLNANFFIQSEKLSMKPNFNCDMRISPETLRFLNDTTYMELIKKCIGMACVYLGQIAEIDDINLVDLCPFPIFGLLMLKRGVRSLICYAKTELDRLFIEEIIRVNNISVDKVTYLIGDDWTRDSFKDKYHAIFCHIFDLSGDLDIRAKDIAQHLKNAHLIQGGLFMPANVTLMGEVVSSNWLDVTNRVHDSNVGYKMSMHINKYQVSQNFGVDYTHLEYLPLTDPVNLGNCCQLAPDVINVPIKNDGDANGIICWYNIELMENLSEISTKRPQSFIDGIAFLANPILPMARGNVANILRCVDSDGSFKLIVDIENM